MRFDFSRIFLSSKVNYYSEDRPLQRMLDFLKYRGRDELKALGKYVAGEMVEEAMFIDHYSKPVLQTWDVLDGRMDGVWISPSHVHVIDRLQSFGVIAKPVIEKDLMHHFISGYLISDSGIFCTLTLTMQTAYALLKYGSDSVRDAYLNKFTSHDSPWLGATYYTEIQGGSDLGANTTVAVQDGGKWRFTGSDKYFASNAGLADASVVTARIEGSPPGAKGISTFFVPALDSSGNANYRIRRLKDKLGTIAVPTGEVELDRSEAYLLGDQKTGIYIAMEILTVSRIDDAIAAVGIARKALWEAYLYAQKREAFGRTLINHQLVQRDLVEMEAEVEASMAISILSARLFSEVWDAKPPYSREYHFARTLSHMAKNLASWSSDYVTRYSMELLGGKGFLHEFPVEKFHRDSIVTSIWEGTSNIQALDLIEVLQKKGMIKDLQDYLSGLLEDISDKGIRSTMEDIVRDSFSRASALLATAQSEFYAKDILDLLATTTASVLLYGVAFKTGDTGMRMIATVYRWKHFDPGRKEPEIYKFALKHMDWMGRSSA
ncbi:MAG: acyl-CoA dehydrogenase family protein [Thermoplasmataceae archaeon]